MIRWILAQIFAAALRLIMVLLRAYAILSVNLHPLLPIPRGLQARTFHLTLVCRCRRTGFQAAVGVPSGRRNLNRLIPRVLLMRNAIARGRTPPVR